jgi:hypothetical protein
MAVAHVPMLAPAYKLLERKRECDPYGGRTALDQCGKRGGNDDPDKRAFPKTKQDFLKQPIVTKGRKRFRHQAD